MTALDLSEDVITAQLTGHSVGLLSIAEPVSGEMTPVPFRISGTDVLCLVPRWSDLADAFERRGEQSVKLVVAESRADGERWLCCHGLGQASGRAWPGFKPVGTRGAPLDHRYLVVQLTPGYLETRFDSAP